MLEYFVASEGLAQCVDEIKVQFEAKTSPHRPVLLTFQPALSSVQALQFLQPEKLPVELPYGPLRWTPSWQSALQATKWALEQVETATGEEADRALLYAYQVWAGTAEWEIEQLTGAVAGCHNAAGAT